MTTLEHARQALHRHTGAGGSQFWKGAFVAFLFMAVVLAMVVLWPTIEPSIAEYLGTGSAVIKSISPEETQAANMAEETIKVLVKNEVGKPSRRLVPENEYPERVKKDYRETKKIWLFEFTFDSGNRYMVELGRIAGQVDYIDCFKIE